MPEFRLTRKRIQRLPNIIIHGTSDVFKPQIKSGAYGGTAYVINNEVRKLPASEFRLRLKYVLNHALAYSKKKAAAEGGKPVIVLYSPPSEKLFKVKLHTLNDTFTFPEADFPMIHAEHVHELPIDEAQKSGEALLEVTMNRILSHFKEKYWK